MWDIGKRLNYLLDSGDYKEHNWKKIFLSMSEC
jgi:hypothetical protein